MTVDYGVLHASVPCGVAVFRCTCGASTVVYDLSRGVPTGGWRQAAIPSLPALRGSESLPLTAPSHVARRRLRLAVRLRDRPCPLSVVPVVPPVGMSRTTIKSNRREAHAVAPSSGGRAPVSATRSREACVVAEQHFCERHHRPAVASRVRVLRGDRDRVPAGAANRGRVQRRRSRAARARGLRPRVRRASAPACNPANRRARALAACSRREGQRG